MEEKRESFWRWFVGLPLKIKLSFAFQILYPALIILFGSLSLPKNLWITASEAVGIVAVSVACELYRRLYFARQQIDMMQALLQSRMEQQITPIFRQYMESQFGATASPEKDEAPDHTKWKQ